MKLFAEINSVKVRFNVPVFRSKSYCDKIGGCRSGLSVVTTISSMTIDSSLRMSVINPAPISKLTLFSPGTELMLLRSSCDTITSISLPLDVVVTTASSSVASMVSSSGLVIETTDKLIGDTRVYSSNVNCIAPLFKSKSNDMTSGPVVS